MEQPWRFHATATCATWRGRAHVAVVGTVAMAWRRRDAPHRAPTSSLPPCPLSHPHRSPQDTEAAARAPCPCTLRAARTRTEHAQAVPHLEQAWLAATLSPLLPCTLTP